MKKILLISIFLMFVAGCMALNNTKYQIAGFRLAIIP
jgi:hypothetical protein